jgi:hypothetical protein
VVSFGAAANSAPPLAAKTDLMAQTAWLAGGTAQKSTLARHNKKGGSRINITLRRPEWADIQLAATFA